MKKILISVPDQLAMRMRVAIPDRQRSKIITGLIEKAVEEREQALFKCATEVEKDASLRKEMDEWNSTLEDGLKDDESW